MPDAAPDSEPVVRAPACRLRFRGRIRLVSYLTIGRKSVPVPSAAVPAVNPCPSPTCCRYL
jgi:hypothetical protein